MSLKGKTPCHECEDTNYVAQGGSFFCVTCGTKYQGEHDMETELDTNNKNYNFMKLTSAKKQKKTHNLYKPTLSGKKLNKYELFQILLKHQVEALIKLGAHPTLKDKVFEFWMKYLSVSKIAFYDVEEKDRQKNPSKETKTKKTGKSTGKKTGAAMDQADMQGDMNGESDIEQTLPDDDTDKHLPLRQRMKLPYTLALCYLALIYTNPLTTFMDIIRWIKEYKMPFCNAKDYLPKDADHPFLATFMAYRDPNVINSSTIQYLQRDVRVMALYLDIKAPPPPIPLRLLIQKHITLLNLPDDMHVMASKLAKTTSLTALNLGTKSVLCWNQEVTAVSYIIVILKLLFGLDGHTERDLSSCSRKLMAVIKQRHALFDFEDWMRFMNQQISTASSCDITQKPTTSEDHSDVFVPENESKLQGVHGPLFSLSKIWDRRKKENQSAGSDVSDDVMSTSQRQNYFRNSSLQHILHPESFLTSLDQFKLSGGSFRDILSDGPISDDKESDTSNLPKHFPKHVNKKDTQCKSKSVPVAIKSFTNFNVMNRKRKLDSEHEEYEHEYVLFKEKTKLCCKGLDPSDVANLQQFLVSNYRQTKVEDKEQFNDIIQQIILTRNKLHSKYVVNPKQTSTMYDEVISVCAEMIYTQPKVLLKTVQETEQKIFERMNFVQPFLKL